MSSLADEDGMENYLLWDILYVVLILQTLCAAEALAAHLAPCLPWIRKTGSSGVALLTNSEKKRGENLEPLLVPLTTELAMKVVFLKQLHFYAAKTLQQSPLDHDVFGNLNSS